SVMLVHRAAVQLEVAAGVVRAVRDAVHGDPRIAQEIPRLVALPHHPEEQTSAGEVDLAGADPRGAVRSDRPDEDELVRPGTLFREVRDRWALRREPVPAHVMTLRGSSDAAGLTRPGPSGTVEASDRGRSPRVLRKIASLAAFLTLTLFIPTGVSAHAATGL